MEIVINPDVVSATAENISKRNRELAREFNGLYSKVNGLFTDWSGEARNNALARFKKIDQSCSDNRERVIEDMVNFMKNQVSVGYKTTESQVKRAASAFK